MTAVDAAEISAEIMKDIDNLLAWPWNARLTAKQKAILQGTRAAMSVKPEIAQMIAPFVNYTPMSEANPALGAQDAYRASGHVSPTGFHKHNCPYCGFIWQHGDDCDKSHNAVPHAHQCPGCHQCSWGMGIYDGPKEPQITNNPNKGQAIL